MLRHQFTLHPRSAAALLTLAGLSLSAPARSLAQSLPSTSPFLPAAASTAAANPGASAYEFVGMTTLGEQTLLGINRQQDKRSFWIPVGKTVGEITAVSYDPKTDQAVIRTGSQTLTLVLRKGGVLPGIAATTAASTAAPTPPTVANAPTPVTVPTRPLSAQEEKEMEARMLVTDLLEIGQQQRKAYEEAQRQAMARAKAGQPAQPSPPPKAGPKP